MSCCVELIFIKELCLVKKIIYILALAFLIIGITFGINHIYTEIFIQKSCDKDLDYEEFRNMKISKKTIFQLEKNLKGISKYRGVEDHLYLDIWGYIAFNMMINDFDMEDAEPIQAKVFVKAIERLKSSETFIKLYQYYPQVLGGMTYFPIPVLEDENRKISYDNSWKAPRTYGGVRRHEGTDLMDSYDQAGEIPIISVTDGVVEQLGWLEKGGNRIGIRTPYGGYYYYAHLDDYNKGLKVGDEIKAGDVLGYMGDTGYGVEGTSGEFPVHLHLGIYGDNLGEEMSINPYYILKILEDFKKE